MSERLSTKSRKEVTTRILVVDDEPRTSSSLTKMLQAEGYEVNVSQSKDEALREIKRRFYHFTIMETNLLGLNSLEVLRMIREINPEIGIIVMAAARSSVAVSLKVLNEGACGYIVKPLKSEEVKSVIKKAIQSQKFNRERKQLLETLKEKDRKLREAQERLMRSEKLAMIGQLATNVAHEIFNPLTAVLGWIQLLLVKTPRGDFRRDHLKEMERLIRRITRLSQGLLTFSRQPSPFTHLVDVNKVMQETLSLIKGEISISKVKVCKRLHPGLLKVMADADQLQQVFVNLISNALQAMPKGGRLTISTGLKGPGTKEEMIEISFTDTGYGIPREELNKIFEPFFTTKKGKRATGLGLAIAQGIMANHRGKIAVESNPGEGTTFRVWLPLKPETPRKK